MDQTIRNPNVIPTSFLILAATAILLLSGIYYIILHLDSIDMIGAIEDDFPSADEMTDEMTLSPIYIKAPLGKPFTDHAVKAHGEAMVARAEECGLNPVETWYNKDEDRLVDICVDSEGKYGIYIYRIIEGLKRRVTAFEKEAKDWTALKDYVKTTGFKQRPTMFLK